jgi:hypothetical protein
MITLQRVSQLLYRVSTGWAALAATAIFVAFMIMVLPAQAAESAAVSGSSETPDTMLYYPASELYRVAEALGEAGRAHYIRARFTFDVIWPAVYFVFLATTISWLAQQGFSPGSRWRMINLLPVVGVIFDFFENIATSLVMARYPAATPVVAELAGIFTLLKWIGVGGSFIALAIVFVAAIVRSVAAYRRQ